MSYMESRRRQHSSSPCVPRRTRSTLNRGPALLALSAVFSILVLVLTPTGAMGQACIGGPAMSGQFTLGAYAGLEDVGTSYGVDSRSNLPGRVGMGARIGTIDLDDTDENITSVGGDLVFQIPRRGALSLCPAVGVDHDFWSGTSGGVDFDFTRWAFPVGLAMGGRVAGGNLIPSARAGLIHQRFSGEAAAGPFVLQRDGNQSDFFLDAGATVHLGPAYGRAGIYRIFDDEGDTVIRLNLGFVF